MAFVLSAATAMLGEVRANILFENAIGQTCYREAHLQAPWLGVRPVCSYNNRVQVVQGLLGPCLDLVSKGFEATVDVHLQPRVESFDTWRLAVGNDRLFELSEHMGQYCILSSCRFICVV